jgi:hypothetical protein
MSTTKEQGKKARKEERKEGRKEEKKEGRKNSENLQIEESHSAKNAYAESICDEISKTELY